MEGCKAVTIFIVLGMALMMVTRTTSVGAEGEMMAEDHMEVVIEHPTLPQKVILGGQRGFRLNDGGGGSEGGRRGAGDGGGDGGKGGRGRPGAGLGGGAGVGVGSGGGNERGNGRGHGGRGGQVGAGDQPPPGTQESFGPLSYVMAPLRGLSQMVLKSLDNVRNGMVSTTTRTRNSFRSMTGSNGMNGRRRPSRAKNRAPNKRKPDNVNTNRNHPYGSSSSGPPPASSPSFFTPTPETFKDYGPPKISSIINTSVNNPHPNGRHSPLPSHRPRIQQSSPTDMKVINIQIPEELRNAPVLEISLKPNGDVSLGSSIPGDKSKPTFSPTPRTVASPLQLHHPTTHSSFSVIRQNSDLHVPSTDNKSSGLTGLQNEALLNQTSHTKLANLLVSQNNPSLNTNKESINSIQDILRQINLDDLVGRLSNKTADVAGLDNVALLNQMSRAQLTNLLTRQIHPSFNTNNKPITSIQEILQLRELDDIVYRLRKPLGTISSLEQPVPSKDFIRNENIFSTGSSPHWPPSLHRSSSFPTQSYPQFRPLEYQRPNVNHIYLLPFDVEPRTQSSQNDPSLVPLSTPKPSSAGEEQGIYYIDITIPDNSGSKPHVTVERNKRRKRSLQFDGWFPVDSNNPMQDPPTLHYQPPPLERVHFGHDPPPEKPMFPVRPENPPVFVVRVENNRPELHEVYGTEQFDYFHINPQTNTVRAFLKEDGSVPQFAQGSSDNQSQQHESPTSTQKSFVEAHSEAFAEAFTESHIGKILLQEQPQAEQTQETPGQNDDFAEKVFVVGDDYDTVENGRVRFPGEGKEYQGELEPAFSDHAPETIVPIPEHMFPISSAQYNQPSENGSKDSTIFSSTFPQERRGVDIILKEDRPAPALYELLRSFHETQIEESPYQASGSEISRHSVMREVPPPNFSRRPTTLPQRRRDTPRKRPATGSSRPWFLIETRTTTDSSKHRYDIPHPFYKDGTRKTNDKVRYKTAFPNSPKTRARSDLDNVPNPHLDDHMNSYKASNSLTATSLSELLQIFQFTAVTTPESLTTDPTTMRSFRYTRPTEEPTTTPFPTTIKPVRAHNTFRYTTAAVNDSTDAYVTDKPEVRYDDVADTNSLDGYLFSDSETNPEYAHPETRTNVIVIPKKEEEEQQSGSQKSGVSRQASGERSQTSGVNNQTSVRSSQTSVGSSHTSGVSSQTSGVSRQTSGVTRQTSGISKQTSRISVSSNGHTVNTYQPPATTEKLEPVIEVVYRGSESTTTESTTTRTTTKTTEKNAASEATPGTWPRYVVIQRDSKVKVFGINSEEEERTPRDSPTAGFTPQNGPVMHPVPSNTSNAPTTPSPPTATPAGELTGFDTSTGAHTPTFRAYGSPTKRKDRIARGTEEPLRETTHSTEENSSTNTEVFFTEDLTTTQSSVIKEPEHTSAPDSLRLPPPEPTQLIRQSEPDLIPSPSEAFAHAFHVRLPPVRQQAQRESIDRIGTISDLGEPLRRSDLKVTRPVFFTKRRPDEPTVVLVEDETEGLASSILSQPFEYVEQLRALERDLRAPPKVPPATETPVRKPLQVERIPTGRIL